MKMTEIPPMLEKSKCQPNASNSKSKTVLRMEMLHAKNSARQESTARGF
jgi:hypothetical protein